MTDHDTTYLAVLVCLYSLFEFLLKRLWWKPSEEYAHTGWTVAKQACALLVMLVIGTLGFLSAMLTVGYGVIALVYVLCESVSRNRTKEEFATRLLERFLLKQVIIGIFLYAVWRTALPINAHDWYAHSEGIVLGGFGKLADVLREKFVLVLAILTAYLFVIDGGTKIVRGILGKFPGLYKKVIQTLNVNDGSTATPTESEENVGEWIGILERIITLTFVLTGNFTAIAFVLTAKSIARFKALEESKDFAEYYLLGTSGSMIAALGAGILVRIVFGL